MSEVEFDAYVKEMAEQAAISYSKVAWPNPEDFATLKEVLERELRLGFAHLVVS